MTMNNTACVSINGKDIVVSRWFPRIAKLRSEYFIPLSGPAGFVAALKESRLKADAFTFVDRLDDRMLKPIPFQVTDKVAVMPSSKYYYWFEKMLNKKPWNISD